MYWALLAHPVYFIYFLGDDDMLLAEQYDVLGHDLSFRGWDL